MYEFAKRILVVLGEPQSITFLMQRLSIAIQRGNAGSVLGTVNSSVDLDDVYLFMKCQLCMGMNVLEKQTML